MANEKNSWFDRLGIVDATTKDVGHQVFDLLRCPFCGSDNVSLKIEIGSGQSHVAEAKILCGKCKSSGPVTYDWDNKEFKQQAADAWNKRT